MARARMRLATRRHVVRLTIIVEHRPLVKDVNVRKPRYFRQRCAVYKLNKLHLCASMILTEGAARRFNKIWERNAVHARVILQKAPT